MINQIGTKIYYCLLTGNVIKIIGDLQGYVKETSFDEETIGLLQFEYGEYPKLSKNSTGVMVNLETKELIFSYEELPTPPQEPTEIELMQEKISILEAENESLKEGLRAVLRGDMQSLAYILYPEDFNTFQKVGV